MVITRGKALHMHRLEAQIAPLLPGIHDDITLKRITPHLSWSDFYSLAAVNRRWCHTIRSGEVYNAGVHSPATETILLLQDFGVLDLPALYSIREHSYIELPPNPYFSPYTDDDDDLEVVAGDGKVYAMKGREEGVKSGSSSIIAQSVSVLDLVRQRPWTKPTRMVIPRAGCGCFEHCGDLYVLGGAAVFGGISVDHQCIKQVLPKRRRLLTD